MLNPVVVQLMDVPIAITPVREGLIVQIAPGTAVNVSIPCGAVYNCTCMVIVVPTRLKAAVF
jgi:hypothetical protein